MILKALKNVTMLIINIKILLYVNIIGQLLIRKKEVLVILGVYKPQTNKRKQKLRHSLSWHSGKFDAV